MLQQEQDQDRQQAKTTKLDKVLVVVVWELLTEAKSLLTFSITEILRSPSEIDSKWAKTANVFPNIGLR